MSTTLTPPAAPVELSAKGSFTIGNRAGFNEGATVVEIIGSGGSTQTYRQGVFEKRYRVFGTNDDEDVRREVRATAPIVLNSLPLATMEVKALNHNLWEVTCQYTAEEFQRRQSTWSFNTSGSTTHVGSSLQTRNSASYSNTGVPNFGNAINVTDNGVEGVDIIVPNLTISETHKYEPAAVTSAFMATISLLTGRVNDAPWRGFASGEVLFTGASGNYNDNIVAITFNFDIQANTTVGGMTKFGWDYYWVLYEDVEDSATGDVVKRPRAGYIEQVYPAGNFSLLGLPNYNYATNDPGSL